MYIFVLKVHMYSVSIQRVCKKTNHADIDGTCPLCNVKSGKRWTCLLREQTHVLQCVSLKSSHFLSYFLCTFVESTLPSSKCIFSGPLGVIISVHKVFSML